MKNDGLYVLNKVNSNERELINRYTIQFPEQTIIETFSLKKDIESYFFSHNEYIEATLLVPNNVIPILFSETIREYDITQTLDLSHGTTDDKFHFGVWMPRTVSKWFDKTQRTISFTVMQPDEKYTRVFVSVDKLGWNLWYDNTF